MKVYLLLWATFCCQLAYSQAGWQITGEAVPGGSAQMTPTDTRTFSYVGHLSSQWFKLSDGTARYVPSCGDSDPLGQTVTLRSETALSETGFRIRYVKETDFFRITLVENEAEAQITVERETPPNYLYLVGGPVNTHDPNWSLDDAVELERDTENPFLFHYKGYLVYNTFGDEGGNVKFLSGRAWDPAWHPAGTGNVPLSQALKTPAEMRSGGADTKWTIPANGTGNGYYEISLNTLNETICVDSFLHSPEAYPVKVFITGDAMPCGWVNDYPEVMMPVAGQYGVYSWSGTASPGEFKFLKARGTWGRCYAATTPGEPVVFNQPHRIVYEEYLSGNGNDYKFVISGEENCTITADLVKMEMTVSKEGETALRPVTAGDAVRIRYDRQTRLLHIDAPDIEPGTAVVTLFNMNGITLVRRTWNGTFSVTLPPGIYGVAVSGAGNLSRNKIVLY
ncbi:MAG: SusF/SusE family outer membrane protein [Tannerella sp.]|jgi:hypothetical protein|nr:SusF/SusE family outer membrane protein [Tannerella sp.]